MEVQAKPWHHGTTLSTAAKLQDKCVGMGSSQVQVRVWGLGAASHVYLVIVRTSRFSLDLVFSYSET